MKIIPKLQNTYKPIPTPGENYWQPWLLKKFFNIDNINSIGQNNFDKSLINWNDKWEGTYNSNSDLNTGGGELKFGDPNTGGRIGNSNLYLGREKASYLESRNDYNELINSYLNNDNTLTDLGKRYIDQYIENSSNGSLTEALKKMREQNYTFSRIPRGSFNPTNWREFILGNGKFSGVANDEYIAQGHNVIRGKVYFTRDKDGNVRYIKNPDGFIRDDKRQDLDFNRNLRNSSTRLGDFVDFEEVFTNTGNLNINPKIQDIIQNTNPSQVGGLGKVNVDTGDTGGSNVFKLPPWMKGIFGNIGKGIGGLFKGDNENDQFKKQTNNLDLMRGLRVALDNAFNTRNTEELISNMDVPLANYTPVYRQVHGDYIAQQQAQREASRLRTSQPITANQQIQSATDLEGIQKGNQLIEQGNAKDAQMFWNTSEQAFQQAKENTRGWNTVANQNNQRLSEFINKAAQLRYDTRRRNQQNWDDLWTNIEARQQEKIDLEEARNRAMQDSIDDLYDSNAGVGRLKEELQNLEQQRSNLIYSGTAKDEDLLPITQKITRLTNIINARKHFNKLRRYGMYNDELWGQLYSGNDYNFNNPNWETNILNSLKTQKNGGILSLFQKGGEFGVVAGQSLGPSNKYLASVYGSKSSSGSSSSTTSSSGSSSSTKDDSGEKTKEKLYGNIADTLKGIDGLNSDVNILFKELTQFFDVQRYNSTADSDPMQFYSMYIRALNRVNQVKQSAKTFDSAYKKLEQNNSMTSPAIDANGFVYVGIAGTNEIKKVTPEEYLNNTANYQLIRNNELLELRKNRPEFAFSDKAITEIAYSGTNIQDIHKYIKDLLSKIGTDKESQDVILKQFGNGAFEGLKTLSKLASGQLTQEEAAELVKNLSGTMTEINVSSETQVRQAKLALDTITAMLPKNMKSLLVLHAGSEENVNRLLTSFVAQGLSTNFEFRVNGITQLDEQGNPKSGSRAGSGSGGGSGSKPDDPKTTTATKWVQGYGAQTTFQIIGGNNKAWTVSGNTMPITDNSDKQLGQSTLLELSSGWGGTLDLRHAYMGNSRISSLGLSQVLLEDGDITLVALPISSENPNKPAFERFKKLSEAERILKDKNIDVGQREKLSSEQKKTVNEVYEQVGLDPLFNDDGSVNKLKFGYFGLIKGITKETAFEEGSEFTRDYLIEASDKERKLFEEIMKSNPKTKDFSIDNGFWGLGRDEVYRGTIFIPVNTNIMSTQAGYGSSYATDGNTDLLYDTKQQRHDAEQAQGGVHLDRVSDKRNFQFE